MENQNQIPDLSTEQPAEYEREALERWGETARQSIRRWKGYGPEKQQAILRELEAVYRDFLTAMPHGLESPQAQQACARWHMQLCHFYEPTVEMMLGLAEMYVEDPRFREAFEKLDPSLPEFAQKAIRTYCAGLAE